MVRQKYKCSFYHIAKIFRKSFAQMVMQMREMVGNVEKKEMESICGMQNYVLCDGNERTNFFSV